MWGPMRHKPVLLHEVLSMLEGRTLLSVMDGTCGAGGHADAILEAHPEIVWYLACDQDPSALELARQGLQPYANKVEFHRGNFSDPPSSPETFDAILLDIGVSSMQLDEAARGFSFMRDGPLDMRMDPESELTAADIVNHYDRMALERIFRDFGEERFARKIADAIMERRRKHPFSTTLQLSELIASLFPGRGKVHPATRVFQALRIAVNRELEVLEQAIPLLASRLSVHGVLCIITFHSLEDRIVKEGFRRLARTGEWRLVSKKAIQPSRLETAKNPRARSAKLRGVEKCGVLL